MEINITKLANVDMWPVSGSIATHGPNASEHTFENAKSVAMEVNILDSREKLEAYRKYLKELGIDGTNDFGDTELNAILIQEVSLELRENGFDTLEDIKDLEENVDECFMRSFYGTDEEYYFTTF